MEAFDSRRSGLCSTANIVDDEHKGGGKLTLSKLQVGSSVEGAARHTGPVHEACASNLQTSKEIGPLRAIDGLGTPKGSDGADTLISVDYAIMTTSLARIPMICDTALAG